MIQFSSLNSQTRFSGESISTMYVFSPLLQVFKKMSQEDYLSPLVWDMHGQYNKAPSNSNRQTTKKWARWLGKNDNYFYLTKTKLPQERKMFFTLFYLNKCLSHHIYLMQDWGQCFKKSEFLLPDIPQLYKNKRECFSHYIEKLSVPLCNQYFLRKNANASCCSQLSTVLHLSGAANPELLDCCDYCSHLADGEQF